MMDDARHILDDLLAEWHHWCRSFQYAKDIGPSAMWHDAQTPRHWDSTSTIADDAIRNTRMEALDFHINELQPLYRTALQIEARNLHSGKAVWTSPRLPADADKRALIVGQARYALLLRLEAAGVI